MNRPRSLNRKRRRLRILISAPVGKQYSTYLRSKLAKANDILRSPLKELSVALIGDRDMSRLHRQFMGIAGPTDVLTFPLELDSRKRPVSGEIVVCVPEARRRSSQLGTPLRDELLLYALHGLLHLRGFDDRTDRQYRRMHRMEDTILSRIGVGAVFSPMPSPAKGRRR